MLRNPGILREKCCLLLCYPNVPQAEGLKLAEMMSIKEGETILLLNAAI